MNIPYFFIFMDRGGHRRSPSKKTFNTIHSLHLATFILATKENEEK